MGFYEESLFGVYCNLYVLCLILFSGLHGRALLSFVRFETVIDVTNKEMSFFEVTSFNDGIVISVSVGLFETKGLSNPLWLSALQFPVIKTHFNRGASRRFLNDGILVYFKLLSVPFLVGILLCYSTF